jgi:prolyl oligopeptidase
MQDAISRLAVYDLDGALRGTIGLPGRGTVTEMRGGIDDRDVYVAFTTFVLPPTILRYDFETRTVSAHKLTPPAIEASQYPMTQAFFPTRDGASLGMLISARDGLALDGSHPVLLTGAGSFGDIASPVYSAFVAAWLEMGGVYAVINARGSGAYGRAGYEPAVLTQKPRSIDDFIAAAEFLVARGYTRPERLALAGSGHGGLLVAAALVRRPALFGAALIDAAPLDLSRFDRFTIGWTWTPEYGTPADPSQLASLLRYSPVHNVKPDVRMPPTLITTGDHDDLVAPPHAFKFAATLQATPAAASSPALLHVEPDAGHGRGTAIAHRVNLDVVRLTFLAAALGVTP